MSRDRLQRRAGEAELRTDANETEARGDQVRAAHLAHAQIQLRFGIGSARGVDRAANRQWSEPLLDWRTDPTGATISGSAA